MKVEQSGIVDGKDIGPATIRMSVPSAWVLEHGGMENIRIVRLSDEGVPQILNTRSAGLENKLGMVFIGESPDGLLIFAVISVNPSEAPPVVATSPVGLAAPNIRTILSNGYKGELIARRTVTECTDIIKAVGYLDNNPDHTFDSIHWQLDADFASDSKKRRFAEWISVNYKPGIMLLVSRAGLTARNRQAG